jgi:hypothetical protein
VFIWDSIQQGAKDNDVLQDILLSIQGDDERKDTLIEYVRVIFISYMILTFSFSRLVMQLLVYVVTLS